MIAADTNAEPTRFHYGDILMQHYKSLDPGQRVAFDVSQLPEQWATFIEPVHPDGTTPVRDAMLAASQLR